MKVEYINPFIGAAQSVLKTLCNADAVLGKVSMKNSPYSASQMIIVVGVVGEIRGQVCFELSQETAKNIASAMMGGTPLTEMDDIGKSAISEMGNMIMGNTCTLFGQEAIRVDITPPSLMSGNNIEISNRLPTVSIPLSLDGYGEITINVTME
ncbi:MAG TPA: chemotaxis protein CheX [Clostridia bacterium]|nr:chemotaxis protein CheX [Clostridia bacterium]